MSPANCASLVATVETANDTGIVCPARARNTVSPASRAACSGSAPLSGTVASSAATFMPVSSAAVRPVSCCAASLTMRIEPSGAATNTLSLMLLSTLCR